MPSVLRELQINRRQSGVFCKARQHFGADFFAIVECENEIRTAITGKSYVRTGLTFHLPAQSLQCWQKKIGFDRWSLTHAAIGMEMLMERCRLSLCSSRSAITRSARTSALDTASIKDAP